MHRIAAIVVVSITALAGPVVAQGPFDDWV